MFQHDNDLYFLKNSCDIVRLYAHEHNSFQSLFFFLFFYRASTSAVARFSGMLQGLQCVLRDCPTEQGALCYSQRTAPCMEYNECGVARRTDVETASVIIPFSFGFELYILEMLKKSGRLTRTLHFLSSCHESVLYHTEKQKNSRECVHRP